MTLISNAGEITPETFLDTTCRENRNISSKDERVSSAVPPCQFYSFFLVKSIEHARDYLQPSTENAGSLYSLRSLLFVHLRFISVWVRFAIIRPGWLIYVLRAPCWGLNPGHPRSLSFSFWRTALPRREFTKQKHVDSTVIPRNGAVCSLINGVESIL